tara:strand:- start:45442 stop:45621 length:180 start_codon:yes stop_codon:yes gene_type:complete
MYSLFSPYFQLITYYIPKKGAANLTVFFNPATLSTNKILINTKLTCVKSASFLKRIAKV